MKSKHLARHVQSQHLPGWFDPQNACWECRQAEKGKSHLQNRHKHEDYDLLATLGSTQRNNRVEWPVELLDLVAEDMGLMMCDQLTKWLECAAIPDQSTEKVAKHFLECFITTFGCPLEVHSDQGSNFQSNLFQAMCGALKIAKTRITPYRPCSNGQVERQNRTFLQIIRCRIQGEVHDWDKDLHLITMALHSTENRSTGFTPNQLMLGREIILPEDLVLGKIQNLTEESSPENWVIDISERMSQIHCEARKHLRMNQLHQKND